MNKANTVMLAIFLTLVIMAIPQTIGYANAQSQQASQQACPTGYTLNQGRCTAQPIITHECIQIGIFIPSQTGEVCQVAGNSNVITEEACLSLGGTQYFLISNSPNAFCQYRATIEHITCPGEITATSGQCIIKPGQGNRR